MGILISPAPFTLLSSRLLHSRKSSGNPKMSKMETNGVTHHNSKGYLQPGDRAPEFKGQAAVLKNGDISDMDIKLSDYLGKYVVFFFYPRFYVRLSHRDYCLQRTC